MLHKIGLYAIVMTLCAISPVLAADYLVFRKGETISNEVWQGTEPVPGVNVPDDATVKIWVTDKADRDPSHYVLTLTGVRRDNSVDEKPESAPLPDVDGFFTEVLQSGAFDDSDMLKMLIVERERDTQKRDALILSLLQGREPELVGKLLEVAAKHNIQLPTPK